MIKKLEKMEDFVTTIKNEKKVLVDFNATWCSPCRMMGRVIEDVEEDYPDITFLKVDTDQFPQIAQQFGIMSIPTLIPFIDGKRNFIVEEGEKKDVLLGARDEDTFRNILGNTFSI